MARRRLSLLLILGLTSPVRAQSLVDFKEEWLTQWFRPDYTHEPNLGDRRFTFAVNGTERVTVGPQLDFDRYHEVLKLVRHKERAVRLAAVLELKGYRTVKAARAITSRLGDEDYEIRETCAWALGELGYRSAILPLIEALQYSRSESARTTIGNSLRKLTGKNYGTSYRRWSAWYEVMHRDS